MGAQTKYLGFRWKGKTYVFAHNPLGCPQHIIAFIVTSVVVSFWRRKGWQCFLFYNGGPLANQDVPGVSHKAYWLGQMFLEMGSFLVRTNACGTPGNVLNC